MPGARLAATSGVDAHNGHVRFTWVMRGADGATVVEGIDFGELGSDGRLSRIVCSFGPLPPV